MQHSLATRYNGPYKVLKRNQKHFIVLVDERQKTISVDRLKACQEEDDADDIVETFRTRSGRQIRRPKQYQIYFFVTIFQLQHCWESNVLLIVIFLFILIDRITLLCWKLLSTDCRCGPIRVML